MSTEQIGVVGLGNMGFAMAKNLLRKGRQVVGFDQQPDKVRALAAMGGSGAASAQAVAEQAEVVILSLPNSPITEQVVLGDQGVRAGVRPGSLVIDMGSSLPSSTGMLAAALAECGADMLDAPVSGGPQGAEAGTMAIMIGGAPEVIERAMPLFQIMGAGQKITVVGGIGSGHTLKAINNYVYASCIWACSEAFVVAAKAGLDANVVQKVISTSTARNNVVEDNIPNEVMNRTFPVWFALGLLNKDVNTFFSIAKELDVPPPSAPY